MRIKFWSFVNSVGWYTMLFGKYMKDMAWYNLERIAPVRSKALQVRSKALQVRSKPLQVRIEEIDGKLSRLVPSGFFRIPDNREYVFTGSPVDDEWLDETTNEIWIIIGEVED